MIHLSFFASHVGHRYDSFSVAIRWITEFTRPENEKKNISAVKCDSYVAITWKWRNAGNYVNQFC